MKCSFKSISGENVVVKAQICGLLKTAPIWKCASPISETWAPRNQRALGAHVSRRKEHNLG